MAWGRGRPRRTGNLPLEASEEIFAYCEANRALIEAEANEERQLLKQANIDVDGRVPP